VIGAESASPAAVFDALANVYGLRVSEEKDGSLLLTRPRIRFAAKTADLASSITHLIPEPLRNALRTEQSSPSSSAGDRTEVIRSRMRMQMGGPGRSTDLVKKAAWRLEGLYDARNKEATEKGELQPNAFSEVLLSQLSAEGRSAFAVTVLEEPFAQLIAFVERPTPTTITDFQSGFLTGGFREDGGVRFFSLSLQVETESPNGGKSTSGTGFVDLPYSGKKRK
jgi:hypothetical protein